MPESWAIFENPFHCWNLGLHQSEVTPTERPGLRGFDGGVVKCAPEFGHENGGAFRTRTHALAECFSLHWPSNSAGVKYPSDE